MNKAEITVASTDGNLTKYGDILSFSFVKDAYRPYTSLNVSVYGNINTENAAEIFLCINEKTVHHGLADKITCRFENGKFITSISSRGFTSLLIQNQTEPGLKTDISINSLMDSFYDFPYITHENNDSRSYIFVKNNSTMWDSIVNLAYKQCGTYPYIRGTNCVRITAEENPESFSYGNTEILSYGKELNCRRMMSNFHMADISGSFGTFELEDSDAAAMKIVRHRFMELDKQFLYNPQEALEYYDKYASRGQKRIFCTYCGYNGEDISDIITFGDVSNERISAITINGNKTGIISEISVYADKFRQPNR